MHARAHAPKLVGVRMVHLFEVERRHRRVADHAQPAGRKFRRHLLESVDRFVHAVDQQLSQQFPLVESHEDDQETTSL